MQRNVIVGGGDSIARAIVHGLIRKGIKLLALDFDLTIVGLHTGGAWRGPVHQLAQHVRPCFRALMEAALETDILHLCIVTYSLQQGLIQDLIRSILPNSDTSRILVRTSSKDWQQKNQLSKQSLGKQQHIAQVTTDLYNFCRAVIQPHEILLMDDDEENCDIARRFGHVAFVVRETVTLDDIYAFVEKIKDCDVARPDSCSRMPEPFVSHMNNYSNHDYRASSLPKAGHSASVFLTSSNVEVPGVRQEWGAPAIAPDPGNFTIPRPVVVNESVRRHPPVDTRIGRPGFETSQPHSATYVVMSSGR